MMEKFSISKIEFLFSSFMEKYLYGTTEKNQITDKILEIQKKL